MEPELEVRSAVTPTPTPAESAVQSPGARPRWWATLLIAAATAFAAAAGTSVFTRVEETVQAAPVRAEPITVTVLPYCEDLVVGRSDAKPQLKPAQVDARWARLRQGATTAWWQIIVQGKTDTPVVLTKIEIVDLQRIPLPKHPVRIQHPVTGCGGEGGDVLERYFEVNFDKAHPKIVARPANVSLDGGKPEGPTKFPYTVSRVDPEVFWLETYGEQPSICIWRLALHWSSQGDTGVEIVERGSEGPFRTATFDGEKMPAYGWEGEDGLAPIEYEDE